MGRSRQGKSQSVFEEALGLLDAAVGGASYRMSYSGLDASLWSDLERGKLGICDELDSRALIYPTRSGGALNFNDFLASLESQVCKKELSVLCQEAVVVRRPTPRI